MSRISATVKVVPGTLSAVLSCWGSQTKLAFDGWICQRYHTRSTMQWCDQKIGS